MNAKVGIHIGVIGFYYTHWAAFCTTDEAQQFTVPWSYTSGNRYFLVVPKSANREGSYGLASAGAERPASDPGCFAQEVSCP